MISDTEILQLIKSSVNEVIPDAKIILFGSRARGDSHKESDWDFLILTNHLISKETEKKLHDKIFPTSVAIASFINYLIVPEEEWEQSPSYYSLYQSVSKEGISI
jgi:predicted nucleotidyltransferase